MTHAGSQLTFEKGEGCGAGITEKRDPRGVTTDLLDVEIAVFLYFHKN